MSERESLLPDGVSWVGGPHDGLRQRVMAGIELPTARVCQCHGALYIAEPFDGATWELRFADRWTARSREREDAHAA